MADVTLKQHYSDHTGIRLYQITGKGGCDSVRQLAGYFPNLVGQATRRDVDITDARPVAPELGYPQTRSLCAVIPLALRD
jgi:hypothetical protein